MDKVAVWSVVVQCLWLFRVIKVVQYVDCVSRFGLTRISLLH
jgi:hypothetical protein